MTHYEQKSRTIPVPSRAGVDGFLYVIREVLKFPRVTELRVTENGEVRFWWNEPVSDDPMGLGPTTIDLAPLSVGHAIAQAAGNSNVFDVPVAVNAPAYQTIPALLSFAQQEGTYPLLFAVRSPTRFRSWVLQATQLSFGKGCFGLPLESDESLPDDVLVLLATDRPSQTILDTTHVFRTILQKVGVK